jgi:hypothetical protein
MAIVQTLQTKTVAGGKGKHVVGKSRLADNLGPAESAEISGLGDVDFQLFIQKLP